MNNERFPAGQATSVKLSDMFETRNKLKRRKTHKDETEGSEKVSTTSTLLAEDNNKKCTSSTDGVITRDHHPQNEKNMPNIKLAPIFLRTTQQNRSAKRTGQGKLKHPLGRGPLLHRSTGTTAQRHDHHEVTEEPPTTTSRLTMTERKGSILSSWKGELSVSARNRCLEEIKEANPSFPLRRVFLSLKKKHRDSLQDTVQEEPVPTSRQVPRDHIGEKRKQPYESDAWDNTLKRRRSSIVSKEGRNTGHCPSSPPEYNDPGVVQPRTGRLSRTYRLKQQNEKTCQDVKDEPKPNMTSQTESASVVFEAGSSLQRNSIVSDVLWTERYSPQHSNEVIDNSSSVNKLHSWLKKWKLRADCDERKKELEKKREESSNESWDCGDFQGEAGFEEKREQLCTTMLITGPPGIGKTSSVYACAQELGFKVFEVNSSSQRSGHNVLTQLKEAVQSHLVETSGKDALKPAYLNIYNTTNVSTTKHDTVTGRNMSSAKHVISTSKRRGQNIVKSCGKRKPSPATILLTNFFKMKAKADQLHSGVPSEKPANDISSVPGNELRNWSTVTERKKMATSLILFEEVDVIFDDDIGFLTAVKTFMRNTKRPVILTTSDPLFSERFDGHFEVTIYKTPSLVNACSYLRLVCLAENVRTELGDVTNLLRLSRGDIRSCLLQLQFWVHSGGQLAPQKESPQQDPTRTLFSNISEVEDIPDNPHLPTCDVGCTASMLGFQTETLLSLLTLLKTNPDMNKLLNILAESWRRGVPLLYSNMELLLPLTCTGQGSSSTCADDVTGSGLQSDRTAPAMQPQNQQLVECRLKNRMYQAHAIQGYRQTLGDKEWQRLAEKFTIPVSFHRKSFNFSSNFFCDPSAVQRRYELSKTVLCSRFFSVLGNRRAVTVEYMPMLRSICRSERAAGHLPGRFVYYLKDVGLGLSKSTIQLLSEDFP